MCRKGTRIEHLDEMQDDLMRNFRLVASECKGEVRLNHVCKETVMRPARRFYISTMQACKVICRMRKGDMMCLERMPSYRKEMFYEIFKEVDKCMSRYEYAGKTLAFIISHVISRPAPRFYVSAETVRKLYFLRKKKNKCATGT